MNLAHISLEMYEVVWQPYLLLLSLSRQLAIDWAARRYRDGKVGEDEQDRIPFLILLVLLMTDGSGLSLALR